MFEKKKNTSNTFKFLFDCGILESIYFLNTHYSLLPSEASRTTDPDACRSTKRNQQVILVGHILLWQMEALTCWPNLSREIIFLMWAQIQDVVERQSKLAWPSDYWPLLFFHVGTSYSTRGNLKDLTGVTLELRSQILQVRGKGVRGRPIVRNRIHVLPV